MARHTRLDRTSVSFGERVYFYLSFVCASSVCPRLLQLTVAGLSRWHSPPLLLPWAQTQTDPIREASENRWEKNRDGWLKIGQRETLKTKHTQHIVGTLVRTKPGLWSLMCSSVAAMSISFTPNDNNRNRNSITATVFAVSYRCFGATEDKTLRSKST